MTQLSPAELAGRQQEMDRLKRIWREVCEEQRNLSPGHREEQAAKRKAANEVERRAYHAECRAALDREIYPVDVSGKLVSAGVEPQHLEGLRKGMDERAAFTASRRWWSQPKGQQGTLEAWSDEAGRMVRTPRLVRQYHFLVLCGGSGIGKSQAAAWCIREGVRAYPWNRSATGTENARPFLVWHGSALATTVLYGNHSGAAMDDAEREWREAERAVVLVLDDLFPQRAPLSKPHHDRLTRLLTARHGAQRATIITANMDATMLAELLDGKGSDMGGPLFRRVVQGGHVVTFNRKSATTLVGGKDATP